MTWQTSFSGARPSGFCEWPAPVNRVAILCICAVVTAISLGEFQVFVLGSKAFSSFIGLICMLHFLIMIGKCGLWVSSLIFQAQNVEVILLKNWKSYIISQLIFAFTDFYFSIGDGNLLLYHEIPFACNHFFYYSNCSCLKLFDFKHLMKFSCWAC